MHIGVTFPQTEIGADPIVIRDYAQAAEALGYHHLVAFDHVLGGDPTKHSSLHYTIGVGWNSVEYEALGMNFHTRGRVVEEQIEVMRLLWSQEVVSYKGKYHTINDAGLNPLPVRRSIPIWTGGRTDILLRRTARLGDGWFPQDRPNDQMGETLERLRGYIREAGRDPSSVGIEARVNASDGNPDEWFRQTKAWQALGATHITINTMKVGFTSPDQHIEAIRRYKEVVTNIAN